ncbi:nuclear transport factor 2 family protein [Mucilaginibacter flavidus]|uniref:nuclear transport factor 2 family protein n=1 Tax=Mucilaginibacter flavidus TaxID=2949309 RepID=UPI0020925271|nr:nuclear transport factor 2 family protein [Mucilaginibacter flavidus]MCO5948996.1 nuclear transport factor 2 family protein [Mucilaginibacter flavidus]
MKTAIKSILVLALLVACARASAQTPRLIDDHFRALIAHDVKSIAAGYSDDAQVLSPNWEGAKIGAAGVTEAYTRYFSSTPDLVYKVLSVINAGDNVVVEYTSGGTLSNPEAGTPEYMKGKKYMLNYCAVFAIKNGKIVKESDYFDQFAFLRQVGFFDQK